MFRVGKSIEIESKLVVVYGWGCGMVALGVKANGFGVSFGGRKTNYFTVMVASCGYTKIIRLYNFSG